MADTFEILAKFLEKFDEDVEGREMQEPTEEAKGKLQRLARGNLSDSEQSAVFSELNRNPQWIAWLAQEVKALRNA